MKIPPPQIVNNKQVRSSNLELYRIIVMLLIVAHHYVVNSGLFEVLENDSLNVSSIGMLLFGAWGKTGINCFILITGYFMCRSQISGRKFIKLIVQILFYNVIIYGIFVVVGLVPLNVGYFYSSIFPVQSISTGFGSCFIIFYLLIPFLNKLLGQIDKKQHALLLFLLITVYSILPNNPKFEVKFNYVSWFSILYIVAAYIRFYEPCKKLKTKQWGFIFLTTFAIAACSVLLMSLCWYKGYLNKFDPYFFVADSNKILSLLIAVTSFIFFKNMKIGYSRIINIFGAATFGVLLIHANSDAMRNWLWQKTIDCVGHYNMPIGHQLAYAGACVLSLFVICALIDWLRAVLIEKHLLNVVRYAFKLVLPTKLVSAVLR